MRVDLRTVGPFQENCYLLVDDASDEAVLVDPGDDGAELLRMVEGSGATLTAIWCTHAHIDHIGAIAEVRRTYPVPVCLHPMDLPWFMGLSAKSAAMYGVPFEQPEAPDVELSDGQVLHCGTLAFTVAHLPGHAPGHVSFDGDGLSFSGDLLFHGSIGRTDLPLCDPFAMDASLARFAKRPPGTIVYPGHGPSTTIGAERESNPFLAGRARALKR
jgi:hydroxyacylglutathione hydrolase